MNLIGIGDQQELVDTLIRLCEQGYASLRKLSHDHFENFSQARTDNATFFYSGQFQVKITPRGGPYFEQLEEKEKLEQVNARAMPPLAAAETPSTSPQLPQTSTSGSLGDPYPTTLEGVRQEMDYWATRQGEGVPGSIWEEGVHNRLEHLRNLEDRFRQQEVTREKGKGAMKQKKELTFETAFNIYTRRAKLPLGSGDTGVVYEVEDVEGKSYALKVLNPRVDTKKRKRFKNEISFCSGQTHRNIVQVIEYGLSPSGVGQSPFYVMPLYTGTLRTLMSKRIDAQAVLPLYSQILDGVEAAHLQGVCHRDLKPENILYEPDTNTLVVADFGIASFKEEDLYTAVETSEGERLANFLYSAPEQRARGKEVGSKADIYALGLILNEMFTGEVPQGAGFRRKRPCPSGHSVQSPVTQPTEIRISARPHARYSGSRLKNDDSNLGMKFMRSRQRDSYHESVDHRPGRHRRAHPVSDPIRLIGADYSDGLLHLKLSQAPNSDWIHRFHDLGTYRSILGKEPSKFAFQDDVAQIPADEGDAPSALIHFKNYLDSTNHDNACNVEIIRERERERRRNELQRSVAEEEKRQRILKNLQL